MAKIGILGPGRVGSILAHTLILRGTASEIVLVGRDLRRADAEAADLKHAAAFAPRPTRVTAGGLETLHGCDVLVITAATPMTTGTLDRMAWAEANVKLFRELIPRLALLCAKAVWVVVSNPVDLLTHQAVTLSGLPPSQIIGTGTLLDSLRFRQALAEQVGIAATDLRVYVLGEHGPAQFPAISSAEAGGEPIEDTGDRQQMMDRVHKQVMRLFVAKKHTSFGIAGATAAIVEAIVFDTRQTMPVSVMLDAYHGVSGVCLSVPVVIGRGGVRRIMRLPLNESERQRFDENARSLHTAIAAIR